MTPDSTTQQNTIPAIDSFIGPVRVLDFTDEKGYLCGKLLADLGADVIKIEPPGGDPGRGTWPCACDRQGKEVGLYWLAHNVNKRGVTLDVSKPVGQELFRRLAGGADIIIESFPPGFLNRSGLGYDALRKLSSTLIMTSITPCGQTGPYAGFQTTDLTSMAMGSMMYLCGDADRPPVRISFPQAYVNAGVHALLGTLLALYHRGNSGAGQQVDVSIQEAVLLTTYNAPLFWEFGGHNLVRSGPYRTGFWSRTKQRIVYECRDGYMSISFVGGAIGAPRHKALVKWMDEHGMAPDFMKAMDWDNLDIKDLSQDDFYRIEKALAAFFGPRTKAELFAEAVKRDIILFPVTTSRDILDDPQLMDRVFWTGIEAPGIARPLKYPAFWFRSTEPVGGIRRKAPLVGEHNDEVYGEAGLTAPELAAYRKAGVI